MPWCGSWGAPLGGWWWVMPLVGLVFMGLMFALCFRGFRGSRGFRSMCGRDRTTDELTEVRRELASLREEMRSLGRAR